MVPVLLNLDFLLESRHSATIPGSDEYREMHGYMRVSRYLSGETSHNRTSRESAKFNFSINGSVNHALWRTFGGKDRQGRTLGQ